MTNAFGIDDPRISKALSPENAARAFRANARAGRSARENAVLGSENSHRALMDMANRGRVPKAMKKRPGQRTTPWMNGMRTMKPISGPA